MINLKAVKELSSSNRHKECLKACQIALKKNSEETFAYKYAGKSLLALGQIEKAHQHLIKASQLDPRDPEIAKDIGNLFLNIGKKDASLQWYEKALEINSGYAPALNNIANLKRQSENNQEAIYLFQKAIVADPKLVQAYVGSAAAHLALGNLDQAASLADQALTISKIIPSANEIIGIVFQTKSNPDRAIEHYQKELKINPQASNSYLNLGLLLLQKGQTAAAIESLEKLSAIEKNQQCSLLLAQGYQKLGQFREALIEYKKININESNNKLIPFNLGLCLLNTGDNINAIKAFQVAIKLDEKFIAAWGNLGSAHMNESRHQEALQATQKVLELDANDHCAHLNLGCIYRNLGNLDQALASTLKSLELKPDNPDAHMNLGGIYKDLGNHDQALASTLKSLALKPYNPVAHLNLGWIYKDLGNLDQALASTLKSLELKTDNPDAHLNLGGIYKDLGNLDQALASTLKSLELKPDNPDAHLNLGGIYIHFRNYDKALASTHQSLELNPDNSNAYTNLGSIYKEGGNLKAAITSISKAIKLDSKNANAYFQRGLIYLELGKSKEAEASLRKSIELNDEAPSYHRYLSILFHLQGETRLAKESIEKALTINPNCRECKLIEAILKGKVHDKKLTMPSSSKLNIINNIGQQFPIVLKRPVEDELVNSLYELEALDLQKHNNLPTKGNAKTSGFSLFEENRPIKHLLESDLISLAEKALGRDVYLHESWFTILSGGGYVRKHKHLSPLSRIKGFNVEEQHYALVYYLEVGDQNCEEPGYLQFYDPEHVLLPSAGQVVIFPADRYHSVRYVGTKDRVIIGVNFWGV